MKHYKIYQKFWFRFLLLWLIATTGLAILQAVFPCYIGKFAGWIYGTPIGFWILRFGIIDFLFNLLLWCFYGGIFLVFLTGVLINFFYTQLNLFDLFEHRFNWLDGIRTLLRFLPSATALSILITVAATVGGFTSHIIPSPFCASWITNCLFSLFFTLTAFFTTADIISVSMKDAVLNTTRLLKEYWKMFLFMLISCSTLLSLLGGLFTPKASPTVLLQLALNGIGFAVYGALGGFLFDFFIRNKDPFLFKQQAQETGLESI